MTSRSSFMLALGLALATAAPAEAVEFLVFGGFGEPDDNEDASEDFKPGIGFGASLGGALTEDLALHAQAQFNVLEPEEDPPEGVDTSAGILLLSGAALVRIDLSESIEVLGGPAAGLFVMVATGKSGDREATASISGFHVGLEAGGLLKLTETIGVGPFVQYARLWATRACFEKKEGGKTSEECDDDPENKDDPAFWSVNVLLSMDL